MNLESFAFMRQSYVRYLLFVVFLAGIGTSCKKQDYPIPYVAVNLTINLDLPSYQPLISPGGVAYVNGGSRGIIIYRNFDEFVALDRHSTVNSTDPCAIVDVNPDNQFELIDTCSGAVYSIMSGVALDGPAQYALQRYNTSWDGGYTVYIYN